MDDTISLGENSILVNEAKSSCREFNSFFRVRGGRQLRLTLSQVGYGGIWNIQSPYQEGLKIKQAWMCHSPIFEGDLIGRLVS